MARGKRTKPAAAKPSAATAEAAGTRAAGPPARPPFEAHWPAAPGDVRYSVAFDPSSGLATVSAYGSDPSAPPRVFAASPAAPSSEPATEPAPEPQPEPQPEPALEPEPEVAPARSSLASGGVVTSVRRRAAIAVGAPRAERVEVPADEGGEVVLSEGAAARIGDAVVRAEEDCVVVDGVRYGEGDELMIGGKHVTVRLRK
ncbi:hypothetical protein JKP88DRAFT_272177 [Tribonema minus]|uniref:Uncharacterized protein n=1 Tax=Tribonema minus TaxID=303371 RepID=A0A835ZIM0_9STRA|nr:hypothetical protein JKP88DRAFT_272177 [Tribonema minus]